MIYQLTEEILHLLFDQCNNSPKKFVNEFNNSNHLIGYNYNCPENRFTHVSQSFKAIVGYDEKNILTYSRFIDKIVHPQDKNLLSNHFRKEFLDDPNLSEDIQKTYLKCRIKHIKGYWKSFIFFTIDYWNSLSNTHNKVGLLFDERIKVLHEKKSSLYHTNPYEKALFTQEVCYNDTTISQCISPREAEVLELISDGLLTKEIAVKLNISNSTVVTHRKNLIHKLGVRNTAELIKKAAKYMLI